MNYKNERKFNFSLLSNDRWKGIYFKYISSDCKDN